jgi:Resolvase, N terminal domain
MERPALQNLLDRVRERRIDVIVVYKVDRLTRSLADFAKLVEAFDGHGVAFVSVTQSFNTTTSMGRLTLNVLLSFAQFEREVTVERIRDKIAASKKKLGRACFTGITVNAEGHHPFATRSSCDVMDRCRFPCPVADWADGFSCQGGLMRVRGSPFRHRPIVHLAGVILSGVNSAKPTSGGWRVKTSGAPLDSSCHIGIATRACLQLAGERIGIGRRTLCVSEARGIPESANL